MAMSIPPNELPIRIARVYWVFFVSFLLCNYGCRRPPTELDKKWPGFKSNKILETGVDYVNEPVRKGYVVTYKKDTIRGYIRVRKYNEVKVPLLFVPVLPLDKTQASDIIQVRADSIDCIWMEIPGKKDTTMEYAIMNSLLWQVLASKGSAKIYWQRTDTYTIDYSDWSTHPDSYQQVCLVRPAGAINIPLSVRMDVRPAYCYADFINHRYGQHVKPSDFKTTGDMLNYIVDQENQRILANKD